MEGAELKAWRRAERQRLLALRTGVLLADRRQWGEDIEARLRSLLEQHPTSILGVYWPFQAEFDPRPLIAWLMTRGSAVALHHTLATPGVVERAHRLGAKVVAWTLERPRDLERVERAGVDAVVVNDPRLFGVRSE